MAEPTRQQREGRRLFRARLQRLARTYTALENGKAYPTYILAVMVEQLERAMRLWDPESVTMVESGRKLRDVRQSAGFCDGSDHCQAATMLRDDGGWRCDQHEAEAEQDARDYDKEGDDGTE